MANDDFFTATDTWQKVELNGGEAQDGTFTLSNLSNFTVQIRKSDTTPTESTGTTRMEQGTAARKFTLSGALRLWVRSSTNAKIGVIPA